jgi:small nuclear ribonucleoprotein (snRNP)-like protein
MNLVIKDAMELFEGENNTTARENNRLGTILLRADNILIIAIESSI